MLVGASNLSQYLRTAATACDSLAWVSAFRFQSELNLRCLGYLSIMGQKTNAHKVFSSTAQKGSQSDPDPGYSNSQERTSDMKTLNGANKSSLQESSCLANTSFYLTFSGRDATSVAQFLFTHSPLVHKELQKLPTPQHSFPKFKCLVQQGGRAGP